MNTPPSFLWETSLNLKDASRLLTLRLAGLEVEASNHFAGASRTQAETMNVKLGYLTGWFGLFFVLLLTISQPASAQPSISGDEFCGRQPPPGLLLSIGHRCCLGETCRCDFLICGGAKTALEKPEQISESKVSLRECLRQSDALSEEPPNPPKCQPPVAAVEPPLTPPPERSVDR